MMLVFFYHEHNMAIIFVFSQKPIVVVKGSHDTKRTINKFQVELHRINMTQTKITKFTGNLENLSQYQKF